MSFYLVRLQDDGTGNMIDVPIPDYGPYEKGPEAAKMAKGLTDALGYKVQPRRIAQAADWRARQRQRLESGELKPLPGPWSDLAPIADHFAHLDPKTPGLIAYTESDELGVIDRTTSITPGRYLTRFYPDVDGVTEEGKTDNTKRRELIAAIDPTGELYLARTPEEIERIYKEGPASCMDALHDFKTLPVWPTHPYGAGDLAVAYSINAAGRIQSRALCWPEREVFGRVYGDEERFKKQLEAEGWSAVWEKKGVYQKDGFAGARLLKIPVPGPDDMFIMPYFDNIEAAADRGDHFVIVHEKDVKDQLVVQGSASGMCSLYRWCPRKAALRLADSFSFVHGVDEYWSRDAIQTDAATCEGSGELWPVRQMVSMSNGLLWSRRHYEQHGGVCQVSGRIYPLDELVMFKGRLTHMSIANADALENEDRVEAARLRQIIGNSQSIAA